MSRSDYKRRRNRRRFQQVVRRLPILIVCLIVFLLVLAGIFAGARVLLSKRGHFPKKATSSQAQTSSDFEENDTASILARAEKLASGYDYDAALALVQELAKTNATDTDVLDAISRYESEKASLVKTDPSKITHVFFHSLIVDTDEAFDGDSRAASYNSVMTTKMEFLRILNAMYENGYVLVRLHDVAHEETAENGTTRFVPGEIYLPEGKKPFVMSQDDVCYYEYMDGDGFASRIVIGADGKPTCERILADGTVVTGDYDLVPILEHFIEEHPDFSYRGARAVLAFTGYQGILGYRTASDYKDSPTYEEDRAQAAKVAATLKEQGWELASHSYGHLRLGVADSSSKPSEEENGFAISWERFQADTDRWEEEVESLIGETDIILYPFGNDIADFHPYTAENPRFAYLEEKGFRYFCNVDASAPYWIQMGDNYLRMARRNLDGYRLYEDYAQTDPAKLRLSDLFDAKEIFDTARPTPVTWY